MDRREIAVFVALFANGAGAAAPVVPYTDKIKNLFGSSLIAYWPMDELTGDVAEDISGNHYDGAYSDVLLGLPGIGDGKTAIKMGDSGRSYLNIASINPVINMSEGNLQMIFKVDAAFWGAGSLATPVGLYADDDNKLWVYKSTTLNRFMIDYYAGGSRTYISTGLIHTDWVQLDFSWSKSGNYTKLFVNGVPYAVGAGSLGTWVGALSAARSVIGAIDLWNGTPFYGDMAHWKLMNRPIIDAEALASSREMPKVYTHIGVIGDSISAPYYSGAWDQLLSGLYRNGLTRLFNHAAGGESIIADMDARVASAASDGDNIIILALGTNDDNAGNMTTLQAKVESNILALKASNPSATLYYLNLLPRWTDVGGGTPVDKSNIRIAIAAACTAQSITCWDTVTTPWITASDTDDGLHPSPAGHIKIATEVASRL